MAKKVVQYVLLLLAIYGAVFAAGVASFFFASRPGPPVRYVLPVGFRGRFVVREDPGVPEARREGSEGAYVLRLVSGARSIRVKDDAFLSGRHREEFEWSDGRALEAWKSGGGKPEPVMCWSLSSTDGVHLHFVGTRTQYQEQFERGRDSASLFIRSDPPD